MTVIAEYTLPGEDFALGRVAASGAAVELDRLVVEDGDAVGYFWVRPGTAVTEETLRETAGLESVRSVDEVGDRCLYRGVWDSDAASLVGALSRFGADVLNATGDRERWWFRIGFGDRDVLTDFQSYCVDTAELDPSIPHHRSTPT
jgi:hypothetical protein